MTQAVGDVDAYARKLCEFFLAHETKPRVPSDEPLVAVHVESLVSAKALLSPGGLQFSTGELAQVREDKRCNIHCFPFHAEASSEMGWVALSLARNGSNARKGFMLVAIVSGW